MNSHYKEYAAFLNRFHLQRRSGYMLLLLLWALVMQSCAVNFTATSVVPGKLLARKSLGFKETSNTINFKEIDPYTVSVKRNICKTELISIEHQAFIETKYGTQSLDCSDAYAPYIAQNITTFGVPLLYDTVTGFYVFRDKCNKNPPVYETVITERNELIKEEDFDSKTATCEDLPVADAVLTAKVNLDTLNITTNADGIASLPPEKIKEIERSEDKIPIKFVYGRMEVTTVHVKKQPTDLSLAKTSAVSDPTVAWVSMEKESQPKTVSDQEKSSASAVSPPLATSVPAKRIISDEIMTVPPAKIAATNEPQKTAKLDQNSGAVKSVAATTTSVPVASVPVAIPVAIPVAVPAPNILSAATMTVPVAKIAAIDEPHKSAKLDQISTVEKSAAAVTPPPVPPESPQGRWISDVNAVSAPLKTEVTETPKMAKLDQNSAIKRKILKFDSEIYSPNANKLSRDAIKNSAPVAATKKSPANTLIKSTPDLLYSKEGILHLQNLFLSLELQNICCPLTDKLLWSIGY